MDDKENKDSENGYERTDIDFGDEEDVIEISPIDEVAAHLELECQKTKELFERLQRLQAEFENYRKRMDNRFSEISKFASEEILLKVLDVHDNILRALEMDFGADPKAAKDGIDAIQRQLEKILTNEGVRPIDSLGTQFDPYYQHALNRKHDPEKPNGVVLEEYQKGYMLKEKVLRPAVVCVNQHEVHSVEVSNDEEAETNTKDNGD